MPSHGFGNYSYEFSTPRKLVIFGSGEFARIANLYFSQDSPYEVFAHLTDDEFYDTEFINSVPVFKTETNLRNLDPQEFHLFVAISGKQLSIPRMIKIQELRNLGFRFASYVSSRSFVMEDCSFSDNVFIFENNTLQSKVQIGSGSVLWSGNHIGHLSRIGSGCFLSSHVCVGGATQVLDNCYLGMNSTIRDQIVVSERTVVGANTYVNRNFDGNCVLFGSPAKILPGADPLLAV